VIAQEARIALDAGAVVLDLRPPRVFAAGHLPGAWQKAGEQVPGRPLSVYCADQVRSSLVASILRRHGHDATLVTGGMVDWLERGFPVEKVAAHASLG